MFLDETERLKTHQELKREIENLKQEFRESLEKFSESGKQSVANRIEAANNKLRNSIPDFEKIQAQVDNRNFEQQRYLNTLLAGNKQENHKKLQNKVDSIQRLVIVLSFIFFLITTLLLIRLNLRSFIEITTYTTRRRQDKSARTEA